MDVFHPFPIMVIFLILGALLALIMYHKQNRGIALLSLRIAHLESSLDMLLDSNRELHKLIVVYMNKMS